MLLKFFASYFNLNPVFFFFLEVSGLPNDQMGLGSPCPDGSLAQEGFLPLISAVLGLNFGCQPQVRRGLVLGPALLS